jgi:hypothetical protein
MARMKRRAPAAPPTTQVELAALEFRAEVAPDSIDREARTVDVVFSVGAPVMRYDWLRDERYIETLSLDEKHVRIDRLNNGAPVLDSHMSLALRNVIGVVEPKSATVNGKRGEATVRFSKRADVEPVWQDVQDRIIRNLSVGYRVYTYEQTTGGPGGVPRRHAIDWEPYEISAVPMGADDGAKIRAAGEKTPTNPCVIVTRDAKETPMSRRAPAAVPATEPAEVVDLDERADLLDPGAPAPAAPPAPPSAEEVADAERERGVEQERDRVQSIMQACRNANMPVAFMQALIEERVPKVDALERVLERVRERAGDERGPRIVMVPGVDPQDAVLRGLENALLHRCAPSLFKLDDSGRNYRGLSLIESAKICLQARGVRTTGLSKMEIAGLALGLNQRAGLHTTSDYANLLADVANKTLRAAYMEAPQTFGPIVRRTTIPDFKPVKRNQLGEAPTLSAVNQHGEFTSGTIGEAKEQYQLATYGRVFGITRQALVNDDTDAFSRVALLFGRSARHLESDLVWAQITSNPTMGDGVALFHANHGNLSGTSDAIAIAPIGAARAAMRQQKGVDAVQFLNLVPRLLIVPTGKETIADQFVSTNLLASQSSNVNPFGGRLTVVAEPRLDVASAVSWYLAASADQIDLVELAMLEGVDGPVVETQVGFKVDGIEVKCRHDVGAKVIDWRGFYKNPGA